MSGPKLELAAIRVVLYGGFAAALALFYLPLLTLLVFSMREGRHLVYEDFAARVRKGVEEVATAVGPDKVAVAVTHGGVIGEAVCAAAPGLMKIKTSAWATLTMGMPKGCKTIDDWSLTMLIFTKDDFRIKPENFDLTNGANVVRIAAGAFMFPHVAGKFAAIGTLAGGLVAAARR